MGELKPSVTEVGLGRRELLARLSKHGMRAIDTLAAACEKGDINAARVILGKMVPDLKAVDITQMESSQARIVINPRIYIKADAGGKQVKLPNITVNIKESKEPARIQEIDISPQLKASPPASEKEPVNWRKEREKGKFR